VISYEAPFGVGYLVAQLAGSAYLPSAAVEAAEQPGIPALARRAIENFITTGTVIDPANDLSDLFSARAGCFVSIKTHDGELRGCIGTIDPVKDTLAEEIIWNAISAATRDPRFAPVGANELPNLKYSVDVLSPAEPCTTADLDPKIYGVIVEDENGPRRGLLLPNLAGIDTSSKQLEQALHKAGIPQDASIKLFRFRADRYSE
jgi:MEMO1 family protein